jgi:hypothetical protein
MLDLSLTPAKELYSFWRVSKISCSALSPIEQLNGTGSGTLPQMSSCGSSRIYFGPSPVPAMAQNPFTDFRLLRFLAKSRCQVLRLTIGDSLRRRFDVAYWRAVLSIFSDSKTAPVLRSRNTSSLCWFELLVCLTAENRSELERRSWLWPPAAHNALRRAGCSPRDRRLFHSMVRPLSTDIGKTRRSVAHSLLI